MNRPLLIGIVLAIPFGIWILGMVVLWELRPQDIAPWSICIVLIVLLMIAYSIHVLRPERMIVATILGEIYAVHAPIGNAKRGSIPGTHIVVIFPPRIARGYMLPLSGFTVPFKPIRANTKRTDIEAVTPVLAFVNLMVRLEPNLIGIRRFVQALPILLGSAPDLTQRTDMQFFKGTKNGIPEFEDRPCICIADLLAQVLQPTIDEAVTRAIAEHSLSTALQSGQQIETKIREHLIGTLVDQAGMLVTNRSDPDFVCSLFDFNLIHIGPSDPDTAIAVSSEMRQSLEARGQIARSLGEAQYRKNLAKEAETPQGQAVLASETMQNLPPGTQIVITPDLVTAIGSKLLRKDKS